MGEKKTAVLSNMMTISPSDILIRGRQQHKWSLLRQYLTRELIWHLSQSSKWSSIHFSKKLIVKK